MQIIRLRRTLDLPHVNQNGTQTKPDHKTGKARGKASPTMEGSAEALKGRSSKIRKKKQTQTAFEKRGGKRRPPKGKRWIMYPTPKASAESDPVE